VRIAVAKESREGEIRVASVPDLVGKLTALGDAKETMSKLLNAAETL